MADYLSAVLQGLNEGTRIGLGIYKARAEEERFRRREEYQRERDKVTDAHWEKQNERADKFYDLQDRQFQHLTNVYRDRKAEEQRQRRLKEVNGASQALFFDADGMLFTDNARFADHLNKTPGAAKLLLEAAVLNGVIPASRAKNYEGLRAIPGPNGGVVFQVYGKSGEGKPITGDAYLSRDGTSRPDDPIVELSLDQLGHMAMGQNYISAKQASALSAERLNAARQAVEAEKQIHLENNEATDEHLAALEAQIAQAQQEVGKFNQVLSPSDRFLERNPQYRNSPVAGIVRADAERANRQLAALSQALEAKRAERAKWEGAAERQMNAFASNERQARLAGGDSGYLSQAAEAPKLRAKQQKDQLKAHREWASDLASKVYIDKEDKKGISKADIEAAILALPPEYAALAHGDPQVMAAINRGAQLMVRHGMNGGLEGFIEAVGRNIDPEKYAQAYVELLGVKDPVQRQEMALLKAQQGAAASLRGIGMLP